MSEEMYEVQKELASTYMTWGRPDQARPMADTALGAYTFESYKERKENGKKADKKLGRLTLLDPDRLTNASSMRCRRS